MLVGAVAEGTGTAAAVANYTVAGKTGTARKPKDNALGYTDGAYVASFAGFVPASAPRLSAIVVLDEPTPYYGGPGVGAGLLQAGRGRHPAVRHPAPADQRRPPHLVVGPRSGGRYARAVPRESLNRAPTTLHAAPSGRSGRPPAVDAACRPGHRPPERVTPLVRLDQVLADVEVVELRGDPAALGTDVTAITATSRDVRPGSLFCCVRGRVADGHDFAPQAVASGAVALLCERPVEAASTVPQVGGGRQPGGHGPGRGRPPPAPVPAGGGGRRHRHQRQDHHDPPAQGRAGGRRPGGRGHRHPVRPPHHPGGHRAAGGPGRGRRPGSRRRRPGGVVARPGPAPGRRHLVLGGRVHQPQPRAPRLPRRHGRLLRGQGRPVLARAGPGGGGQRRRPLGPQAAGSGPPADPLVLPGRRGRARTGARRRPVPVGRAPGVAAPGGDVQRVQRPGRGHRRPRARRPAGGRGRGAVGRPGRARPLRVRRPGPAVPGGGRLRPHARRPGGVPVGGPGAGRWRPAG